MKDAHNHLHDERLRPHRTAILAELSRLGVEQMVVNGTCEEDWPAVAELAATLPSVIPAFGLHPWFIQSRSPDWDKKLRAQLEANPQAGVGEIGLDRWIEGHDLLEQTKVFVTQLELAAELKRPVTIHCIQAWGALLETLQHHHQKKPASHFLIHAYGGSVEMIANFSALGGYFSFSPYFLHPRKGAQLEVFRRVPSERLLVETDAPDLRPPDEFNQFPLRDPDGTPINHPANLEVAYTALADLRQCSLETLTAQVSENFDRLFQSS